MAPVSHSNIRSSSSVFGITKKGQPCKICIKVKRFCHLHRSPEKQSAIGTEVPPQEKRSPPICPREPPPAFNQTTYTRDLICPLCLRLGKDCIYHTNQHHPSNVDRGHGMGASCNNCSLKSRLCWQSPLNKEQECQVSFQEGPKICGITLKGSHCKICLLKGEYCKKHESQRGESVAATIIPRMKVQSSRQDSDMTPVPFYGITVTGKPCKICIRKGDFCGWHESQRQQDHTMLGHQPSQSSSSMVTDRVYGMTVKGTPCKICIFENDYCHFHVDQKPLNEASATTVAPTPSTPFALTKNEMPCKLCIRKGGICHVHDAGARTSKTRQHHVRSCLSLLLFGIICQYAVFVGLMGGAPVASLPGNVFESYNGISINSIVDQGVQILQKSGLASMMEGVLHNKAAPVLDNNRSHYALTQFEQSNGTSICGYPIHSDLSMIERN